MDRSALIAIAATALLYFGWQWSLDYRYPDRHLKAAAESEAAKQLSPPIPPAPAPAGQTPPTAAAAPAADPSAAQPAAPAERITLDRPLFTAVFTTRGGALVDWTLKTYDDASQPGRPPVSLTTATTPSLTTAMKELGYGDLTQLDYTAKRIDAATLEFSAEVGAVRVRKTYQLEPEGYGARLSIELENRGAAELLPEFGVTWPAARGPGAEHSELGLVAYRTDELIPFAVAPLPSALGFGGGPTTETVTVAPEPGEVFELDWAGAHTRYFVAAILPDKPTDARAAMIPKTPGLEGLLEVSFAAVSLPPGTKLARDYRLYLGPKEAERLAAFGAHLDEAIQRGWVPWLADVFTSFLTAIHRFVPNYGLAILLLTIVVRVAMAPLMVGQMRSMKRMADLAPKVKAAQERFPDDRVKQQEAIMSVYQQAGVSPFSMFGGCLPMLLQLPIFVGFYSALQGSIQLRQQPFYGWITDLSQPESLFLVPGIDLHVRALPLLLGGAMVLQQRLTPTPNMDPAQARMMQIVMPVMMTLMFYQFASGLGLYWLTSTLVGIGQQVLMNRSKPAAAA